MARLPFLGSGQQPVGPDFLDRAQRTQVEEKHKQGIDSVSDRAVLFIYIYISVYTSRKACAYENIHM